MKLRNSLLEIFLSVISFLFFIWSFILTDRSLYYSQNSLFLTVQRFLWTFADNRLFVTVSYVVLLLALWSAFVLIIRGKLKRLVLPLVFLSLAFFVFANPALSYDLFNYMFDAKLVVHYHLDPHTTSAYAFSGKDTWVAYMRNVFFPTTYGYAWTAISLVPIVVGMGKFILSFWAFKLWAALSLAGLFVVDRHILRWQSKKADWTALSLFFLNPLVWVEALMSAHNDIWMMLLAHLGIYLLLRFGGKLNRLWMLGLSLLALFISSQVKRATALLIPIWVGFLIPEKWLRILGKWFRTYWADLAAILVFLPLFTDLSRQFHPWYLLWSLSFIPFMRSKYLRLLLILFSFTSGLRYIPYLYLGNYTDTQELYGKYITWSAVPVFVLVWVISQVKKLRK